MINNNDKIETLMYSYDRILDYLNTLETMKRKTVKNRLENVYVTCDKLCDLNIEFALVSSIYSYIRRAFSKLTDEHKTIFRYKYYSNKPKLENFDYTSRNYYRQANKLVGIFNNLLDKDLDEPYFDLICQNSMWFKFLYNRVQVRNRILKEKYKGGQND